MRKSILIILIFISVILAQSESKIIVGYFTSWSVYGRDYHVSDIPADKVTHINYAFANIADGEIVLGDPYADIDRFYPGDSWDTDSLRGNFHQLILLREDYPHVRTLISVGGWTWSSQFPEVASTDSTRARFASSCVDFVTDYSFDGVDIDWEYPGPEDRRNFTLLLAELRRQLDSLEIAEGREYLLTIAAPAGPGRIANIEVDSIGAYLDWANIMSYDYHGPWGGSGDSLTNFNAALYPSAANPLGEPFRSYFNQSATVDTLLALGLPRDQIVLGLPFYGRGYASVEGGISGLYSEYAGPPSFGTWENGVFDFDDLHASYIGIAGYERFWSEDAFVPWLYNSSTGIMISYDDTMSIGEKARYIMAENLAGAMFWEFTCDEDEMLLDKLNDVLESGTHIETGRPALPQTFEISAHPNPFNASITINIDYRSESRSVEQIGSGPAGVGDGSPVPFDVEIYDVNGRRVSVIPAKAGIQPPQQPAGFPIGVGNDIEYIWSPHESLPSGVYLVRATIGNSCYETKIMFVK